MKKTKKNENNDSNYFIEFLRFIFALIIMFYHSWWFLGKGESSLFHSGYLAVNFYFIITGYFMMTSLNKHNKDTKDFICGKLKRILPGIIVAFFICFLFTYGRSGLNIKTIFSNDVIADLLLLKVTGYAGAAINPAWWYLSSMLLVVFLLYPLAKKFKEKYIYYIAPLIILTSLALINHYDISMYTHSSADFIFINGFYKAIIYIALGNISYELAKYFKTKEISNIKSIFLTIFECFIYLFTIFNMHFNYIGTIWYAILFTLGVSISFSGHTYTSKIFKHKIWKKLGNYGFYLYLTHGAIRTFMDRRNTFVYYNMLPKYILVSLVVALFVYVLLDIIYPYIKNKKKKFLEV